MLNLPKTVLIEDEALRDGLQNEKRLFSVAEKLELVAAIADAGVRRIQVGSFVSPRWAPQMANTDELFAALPPREGVVYSGLVLNAAGLDRALAVGARHLSISVSASETHSRKNTNKSVDAALADILPTIERALAAGVAVRAGVQSALGCGYEGDVDPAQALRIARLYRDAGVREINIADTAGLADPQRVHRLVTLLREALGDEVTLSLHLHDTRGLGLANMLAGLQAGVTVFDAAVGGLGGCPFIPAATGNIATEDAVFALERMGVATGIDWTKLQPVALRLAGLVGRKLPSRMAYIDAAA
ncbi:MAG: hydroxymethylglutaryl-CoA lyase [Rhizobiales bacterium]|nr:hydroxymethylglutaryl-CoA lyase [Hyphomicrobiales bacterium]